MTDRTEITVSRETLEKLRSSAGTGAQGEQLLEAVLEELESRPADASDGAGWPANDYY